MLHTSGHSHVGIASNASTAPLVAPMTLSTSSQNKNFSFRNLWRTGMTSAGIVPMRCLCHDLQAYSNTRLMWSLVLSFRSMTSELVTPSGRLHMFRSNSRFIVSRHPTRSSVCWSGGQTRNRWLVHRAGSTTKSGNDLWKGRTGWSMSSWRTRSDCSDDRIVYTSSGSKPRSVAMEDGERGFAARTTAPRTERTLGSFSWSSPLKAS